MKQNQHQQGDVLFKPVAELPNKTKLVKPTAKGAVLAEGETTGHSHHVKEHKGMTLHSIDNLLFMKNSKPVVVEHEEHNPVTLEPGIWQIEQVREYDYFQDMERTVVD